MERIRVAAWALRLAWQIDKALLLGVFATATALSVLPAASLGLYKDVIAQLSDFVAFGAGTFTDVLPALLAYGALLALISLSARVNADFIATIMSNRFTYGMQDRLMEVVDELDVLELLKRNVNEDFNYIIRQSNALSLLVSGACSIGAKVVSVASLLAVAWGLSRPVFFITLAYVTAAVAISTRFSKGTRFSYPKFRKAEVKAAYLQNMPLESNIAKEIRVYGCAEEVVESWRAAYAQRLDMELERFRATETSAFALGASFYAFLAAVVAYLLVWVSRGQATPAELLTVFTLCTNLYAAMSVLTRDLINFDDNLFRIEQMRNLLSGCSWKEAGKRAAERRAKAPNEAAKAGASAEATPDVAAAEPGSTPLAATSSAGPAATPTAAANVVFSAREVSFSYDGSRNVLEGVSFDVREGEVVALVGANGSGKSTLVKLLIGVLRPSGGSLLFRGRPYSECSQDYLSSQIGAFFQDFYLFHHPIADNIAYGAHDRIGRTDEVCAAVEKGGAARIVERLPQGLSTLAGKRIDKAGAEFSGGERQLLATARTYMGDKRVLIFDEPASMLDPLAELGQFEAIRSRIGADTGILISHRVGFARLADRIIMMEGGRIVEEGTHDELMELQGAYASFFREQARWYEPTEGAGA